MVTYIVYVFIVFLSFLVSLFAYRYDSRLRFFPWILGSTVLVEILVGILSFGFLINPYWIYHFSAPALGSMMMYYFYLNIRDPLVKKILLTLMVLYVLASLALTFFFYEWTDFPGLPANAGGFILIGCGLFMLLTLEPIHDVPIYKHPIAWISFGVIIFYTGTFFLNGIYNYLVETKNENRLLIHRIINNGLNIIMYGSFTVAFLCSHRLRKFSRVAK
jgi:hypothetical protein